MEAVSFGFRSASSPTRCTACAWTWPWTWATSINWDAALVPGIRAWPDPPSCALPSVSAGIVLSRQDRNDFGGQDALDQRPDHHEQHHEAEQHHDAEFDDVHDVILGELQHAEQPARLDDRGNGRRFGKAEVDDLDLVAALLVEADRRTHQGGDAVELFLAAVLIDHLAFFVLGIGAVDQHRDRDPVDASGLGNLGLGGAGNLVVVGLFALLALVAGRRPAAGLVAGQFVVDGDLAVVLGGS